MRYKFLPAHPGAVPASSRGGPESMRSGCEYDLDAEWAQVIVEGCPGLNGASCLVLVSVEEPHKPVEPAKKPSRGPGRPSKA